MSEVRITISELGAGELSVTRLSPQELLGERINLVDPDIICDPYPLYRQLREFAPFFRSQSLFDGAWVFLDYEDVYTLFRDTEHLSNAKFAAIVDPLSQEEKSEFNKLINLHSRWMVFFDPPKHTRLRKLMARGFPNRVKDNLAPFVRQHVDNLIASFQTRSRIDVIGEYAWKIPLITIAHILGVPSQDLTLFARWTGDIAVYMGSEKPHLDLISQAQQSLIELESYFRNVVAERRANPLPDDLLSLLIAAEEEGDVLTEEELFAQCTFLCFTGNETTKNLIGNSIYSLLRHPDQRYLLANNPAVMSNLIEEVVRFECPVQFIGRIVREDFVYKSAPLKKGDYIVLMIGAANRDPKQFNNPDKLDITRKNIQHISFGEGIHTCLGQGLARVEAEIAVSAFLTSFPNADLDLDAGTQWQNNPGLRGLRHLFVRLNH